MYGPMWPFYSCMGLMTRDIGIPRVDGLSTDTPGFRASQLLLKYLHVSLHNFWSLSKDNSNPNQNKIKANFKTNSNQQKQKQRGSKLG